MENSRATAKPRQSKVGCVGAVEKSIVSNDYSRRTFLGKVCSEDIRSQKIY